MDTIDLLARTFVTLQAGGVRRYHAEPSVAIQPVNAHAYNVTIWCIYLTRGTSFDLRSELLIEALLHDSAEKYTGDIPFTIKQAHPDLKERFDELEEGFREKELILPSQILTSNEWAILKLADTLDGLYWCLRHESAPHTVSDRWKEAFKIARVKLDYLPDEIWHRANAAFAQLAP